MAFIIPEDIASLDNDQLAASVDEALAAFAPLGDTKDEEITEEQATEMEALSAFVQSANEERGSRDAAAAERSQKLASIRESMATKPDDKKAEDEEIAPEAEAPVVDEVPVVEVPVVPEAPAEPVIVDEIPVNEEEDEMSSDSALVAGGNKAPLSTRAARNATKASEVAPEAKRGSIVASANVPGVSAGKQFNTLKEASEVLESNLNSYGSTKQPNVKTRNGGLVLQAAPKAFSQNDYLGRESEMLLAAASESRLEGNSLVAAGGWGAPSEQVLDFCSIETTEGLLELPEVTITRGGINYTKGPDFASVLANATGYWDMTEAVAEAGSELKTSLRPKVPDFIDARLDAVGVMVEAGLLLRNGWPELIERYAELALVAHQHKLAKKSLAQIKAFTGAAVSVANGFGNALDGLHVLEVAAQGERQRNAMALNSTLEVIAPIWYKSAIRADLANRNGLSDSLAITDAQIDSYFAARNLRVQWVYNSQDLDVSAGIAVAYPTTVELTMYPAGTYVRGVTDVISLDTVYDSTNLKKNEYVHLFVEQGSVVTNPCFNGRALSFPLGINGRTGAADITSNLFV